MPHPAIVTVAAGFGEGRFEQIPHRGRGEREDEIAEPVPVDVQRSDVGRRHQPEKVSQPDRGRIEPAHVVFTRGLDREPESPGWVDYPPAAKLATGCAFPEVVRHDDVPSSSRCSRIVRRAVQTL
jgi:hypothetical protein